jgi:hypothetical protein
MHGFCLLVGKELGFDKAAKLPCNSEFALPLADELHKFYHRRRHVELVVVHHKRAIPVLVVELGHFVDNAFARPRADMPQGRRRPPSAKTARHRTPELGDKRRRADPVNVILVAFQIDKLARRVGRSIKPLIIQKHRAVGGLASVGINELWRIRAARFEDGFFSISGNNDVKVLFEPRICSVRAANQPFLYFVPPTGDRKRCMSSAQYNASLRTDAADYLRDLDRSREVRRCRRNAKYV